MLIIILKFIVSAGICIYLFLRVTAYRKSSRKLIHPAGLSACPNARLYGIEMRGAFNDSIDRITNEGNDEGIPISNAPKAEEPLYRQQLEKDLHHALENEEFFLVYQPQVDVPRQKIVGAEVLLRWEHPAFGIISPEIFIPILEETGLICPIGEWVLLSACRQLNNWEEHLTSAIRISVNLSVRQLMMDDIPSILSGIIRETNVDPRRLELEITESGFLTHTERMIATVESIKATGVSIAIDDFGSGQSSLCYFKYFPIDTLKVDRIFIREMISSNCDQAIVSSLIFLAHNLGMKVIAEGVERMEELDLLSDYQCDEVQGFLYSRPLAVRDFEDLLASEGIFDCNLELQ